MKSERQTPVCSLATREPEVGKPVIAKRLARSIKSRAGSSRRLLWLLLVSWQSELLGAGPSKAGAIHIRADERRQPQEPPLVRPPADERAAREAKLMKSLDQFLEALPTLSVGQKHSAHFECELDASPGSSKLIWLRLARRPSSRPAPNERATDDTTLISFDRKIIVPDRRFKVRYQAPVKWVLSIDNVGPADDNAYYLCQSSSVDSAAARKQSGDSSSRFVGGALLNVLVPPVIVENATSANQVRANEYEAASIRCRVVGEPQSQLMWRREDGRSLDGLEQRFRHELERRPHELLSVDSAELIFGSISRDQAGAYLCIASNGVQPGVSQRINVLVDNCRDSPAADSRAEPCDAAESDDAAAETSTALTSAGQSGAAANQSQQQPASALRNWKTTARGEQSARRHANQRLAPDKRRPANRTARERKWTQKNKWSG